MRFTSLGVRKVLVNDTHTTGLSCTSAVDLLQIRGLFAQGPLQKWGGGLQQPCTQRDTLSPSILEGEGKRTDYLPTADPVMPAPSSPTAQDGQPGDLAVLVPRSSKPSPSPFSLTIY